VGNQRSPFGGRPAPERYGGRVRGEYKVPGGKLVSVELDIVDDRLANVHVAGDFFLEPDSALGDIDRALTGMPVGATGAQLTDSVISALPPGVEMVGFDAQAVGIAVRRAVGAATSWGDHTFDLIPPMTLPPVLHVALDEVLSKEVAAGRRPPLLRIWDWDSSVVVIGSFQSVRNEIDSEAAAKYHISVVRRVSGGGAMFMEPGNCITYSMVVPPSLVEGMSFIQSYAFLDAWVVEALAKVGVNARYVPINDIASDKGKIGGAAQKRFVAGAVLHHATMAYDIDAEKMMQVIRIGREKISDKGIRSAVKRVDPMRSQTGMSRAAIIDSLMTSFRGGHRVRESRYTEAELDAARQLADTKFLSDAWTYRVP
jgi:lipoate-protein ligase A